MATHQQIEGLLQAVRPHLTAGLQPMDAIYVLGAYQRVILPHRLGNAHEEPAALTQARDQVERERILTEIAPLPATERVAAVRREMYSARLATLSSGAFRLARRRAEGRATTADGADARQLLQQTERLIAEVEATAGVSAADLQPVLSETLLDASYAIEPGLAISFRLNHALEAKT